MSEEITCARCAGKPPVEALISEHKLLREEISMYNHQIFRVETTSLIAAAGSFAWLSTVGLKYLAASILLSFVNFLPVLILVIAYQRLLAFRFRSARIGMYIAWIEQQIPMKPGWENFVWHSRGAKSFAAYENWKDLANNKEIENFASRFGVYWKDQRRMYFIVFGLFLLRALPLSAKQLNC